MSDELRVKREDVPRLARTHFNMTNHPPTEERIERIERLRDEFRKLSSMVYVNCPESRERALALTGLEQALMWSVASIAREKWEDMDEINTERINDGVTS